MQLSRCNPSTHWTIRNLLCQKPSNNFGYGILLSTSYSALPYEHSKPQDWAP